MELKKCNNCGGDSHCETRTTRTEQQYKYFARIKFEQITESKILNNTGTGIN